MDLTEVDMDDVLAGIAEGSRRALLRHKLLGESVVTRGADGNMIILPPEDIEVPGTGNPDHQP